MQKYCFCYVQRKISSFVCVFVCVCVCVCVCVLWLENNTYKKKSLVQGKFKRNCQAVTHSSVTVCGSLFYQGFPSS